MQNERKRILQLVENGIITATEAIGLLEKLEQSPKTDSTDSTDSTTSVTNQSKVEVPKESEKLEETEAEFFEKDSKDTSKEDEFIDDLKKDFTQLSSRIMELFGNTVNKVKDMDLSSMSPSSKKQEWTIPLSEHSFENISVDIPNGHLTIRDSADGSAYLEVAATPILSFGSSKETSEEELKKQFSVRVDTGTLRINTISKTLKTDVIAYVPKGDYKKVRIHLFNGGFKMHNLDVDQLRVETKNGSINLADMNFDSVEIESANGEIEVRDVSGREFEAETLNGRVYIDGVLKSLKAKSVNGNVILTTTSQQAEQLKARTTAGSIELYVPESLSLAGEVSSALGKMDVKLSDVEFMHETNQVFSKSMRFNKELVGAGRLIIDAETKTGSVIIRYTL